MADYTDIDKLREQAEMEYPGDNQSERRELLNALPSLLAELVGLRTEVDQLRTDNETIAHERDAHGNALGVAVRLINGLTAERDALQAEVERLTAQVEAGRTINNQFADQSGRDGQALLRKDAEIRALQARIDRALWLLDEADAGIHHKDVRGEPRNIIEAVRTALGVDPQKEADGA